MQNKNCKVGIITFHNAINYGALLQTYALQQTINNIGYEAIIIDYSNPRINKVRSKPKLKEYKNPFNYHNDSLIYEVERKKEIKLREFLKKKINKSNEVNKTTIAKVTEDLDVVFTGSDQVWNDSITDFDDTYYLDFVPAEKRCSYAASIGKETIPIENVFRMQKLLQDFRAISVREESAKEALKNQMGINATRVLDPTLLLSKSDYEKIAKVPKEKNYVLLYILLYSETLISSAKKLAKEKGIPLLCINSSGKRIKGIVDCSDAGIEEWLGLFLNADFIFTNSFHGTAFSINFNKQFNVELPPAKIKASSRVKDILRILNLENQVIENGIIKLDTIDYMSVNTVLNSERNRSKKFLLDSIENKTIEPNKAKIEKSIISIPWDHCSGCGFCKQVCPTDAIILQEDSHGFMHPTVEMSKCIQCGKCLNLCPYKKKEAQKISKEVDFQSIYAAYSKNPEVVKNSSSGGLFYEIANKVIQENGVVYGAAFDEEFSLAHRRVDKIEDIKPLMGSKYVQSNAFFSFDSIKEDIKTGRKVLFIGTPCQVSALRALNKNAENLLLVDLVCHGVPSQSLIRNHVKCVESTFAEKVKEYIPRSKVTGWIGCELFNFNNGKKEFKHPVTQAYRRIFYSNLALRESCYNCPYTDFDRPGDLTLADYWGIEKNRPDLYRKEGLSMLLVNSEKGKHFIETIDTIVLSETDRDTIVKEKQPHLFQPVKKPNGYKQFWNDYQSKGWKYIIAKYAECSKKQLFKWHIKKVLGKVK